VVEGNCIINTSFGGPYHDTWNARDLVFRNNYQRGVQIGPYQVLAGGRSPTTPFPLATPNPLTYALDSPTGIYVATGKTTDDHRFLQFDAIAISGASGQSNDYFNGTFTVSSVPDSKTFKYNLAGNPNPPFNSGSSPTGNYQRLYQTDHAVMENNVVELIPNRIKAAVAYGISFYPTNFATPPLYQQAVVRRNVVRHMDGIADPVSPPPNGVAIYVNCCGNAVVEENLADLGAANPISFSSCGSTEFFANQTSAGALIQGYDSAAARNSDELSTRIVDAALFSF